MMSVDSRPSDALALALRVDCPIFVEDEVLKNSKNSANSTDKVSNEELRKWLENLNDEDMGSTRCKQGIKERDTTSPLIEIQVWYTLNRARRR